MGLKSTITVNGELIQPGSGRAYELASRSLWNVERLLQDEAEVVIPAPLRGEFESVRGAVTALASKAGKIAADANRWDGDVEKALNEARWREDLPEVR